MRANGFHVLLLMAILSSVALAKKARTIRLGDQKTESIAIGVEGAVLNFPSRPTKVILGNKGAFAVEYIEDDLAISPLRPLVHSTLFVYLDGRRFGFILKSVPHGGDEIVVIRDEEERKIKVKVRHE